MDVSLIWWVWRSWLARQIVALEVEGSSPSIHPFLYRILSDAFGLSPSGKAQGFDPCITLVRIQLAQLDWIEILLAK